jgi:hypothetical protein
MYRTFGIALLAVGILMLFVGFASPLVTVIYDTSIPETSTSVPADGVVYAECTSLSILCRDTQSGISSVGFYYYTTVAGQVSGAVPGTWYGPWPLDDYGASGDWRLWKKESWLSFANSGKYGFRFRVTNGAGLYKDVEGTLTIYKGLEGKWYVNDILISSSSQTVYVTSATVSFKFVKTAGVEDSKITCTVVKGTTTLITLSNSAASTWTGTYTFAEGIHALTLNAYDGSQTITMSILDLRIGMEGLQLNLHDIAKIVGAIAATVGLALVVYPFKTEKEVGRKR